MYLECNAKRNFAIALLGKKLGFHTEVCEFREKRFLKLGLFGRVKELSKSKQTRYGIFHLYLECNAKGTFAIALLGRKLGFHTEICEFRE